MALKALNHGIHYKDRFVRYTCFLCVKHPMGDAMGGMDGLPANLSLVRAKHRRMRPTNTQAPDASSPTKAPISNTCSKYRV